MISERYLNGPIKSANPIASAAKFRPEIAFRARVRFEIRRNFRDPKMHVTKRKWYLTFSPIYERRITDGLELKLLPPSGDTIFPTFTPVSLKTHNHLNSFNLVKNPPFISPKCFRFLNPNKILFLSRKIGTLIQ